MKQEDFIPAREICRYYQVEISFIHELHAHELLETEIAGEDVFVPRERLGDLERFINLYYEMHINLEGIEVVDRLLRQLGEANERMRQLENRLRVYE